MTPVELLTQIASVGCRLRRLPGDRLEVLGDIPPGLAERIVDAKTDLLAVLPDPAVEIARFRADAVACANRLIPPSWCATQSDWATVDALDARFDAASAAGDIDAARGAHAAYLAFATRIRQIEDAIAFAEDSSTPDLCTGCWRCAPERFPRPTEQKRKRKSAAAFSSELSLES